MPDTTLTKDVCRNYIEKQLFQCRSVENGWDEVPSIGPVGIEIEAFPYRVDPKTNRVRPVSFRGGSNSLSRALVRTAEVSNGEVKFFPFENRSEGEDALLDKILFPEGDSFTFEPGGQVEIVTAPCNSLEDLTIHLKSTQEILRIITKQFSIRFAQIGTNPWFDADQIGLQVGKPRYRALNDYFDGISSFGKQMMRLTCSLQVNLDLGPCQDTFVRRFVAANQGLVPIWANRMENCFVIIRKIS